MVLPNFLVIGSMKSGTTSLYRYLRDHPRVFMPDKKEPEFFSRPTWESEMPWYESLFRAAGNATAVGEASPIYTRYPHVPDVPERMAKVLPEARLIYLVRHPIERMRSQYLHAILTGRERDPIEEALVRKRHYANTSRYAMQVERYLEHFALDQLLIIKSEDLWDSRGATMRRVFEFIGVDPTWVPETIETQFNRTDERRAPRPVFRKLLGNRRYRMQIDRLPLGLRHWLWRTAEPLAGWHVHPARGAMSEELRDTLAELVRDDVRRLRTYMGDGFDGWGIA